MNYILSIESSCDETSLALLKKNPNHKEKNFLDFLNSHEVVSSIIASQAAFFAQYGGVIPEISARQHAEQIFSLFQLILNEASTKESLESNQLLANISEIYITTEPGLVSALKVGYEFGKVIASQVKKLGGNVKVIPINHLKGHIISSFYQTEERWGDDEIFPHLHLLVSGGNTQLLLMKSPSDITIVGQTLDDAAGECLDKIGRMVGLDYPAGAVIGSIVGERSENPLRLPVGMKGKEGFDFSYSGMKTAVKYYIRDHAESGVVYEEKLTGSEVDHLRTGLNLTPKLKTIDNILVSTQTAVLEQLILQTKKTIKETQPRSLGLSGGVSASKQLRKLFNTLHPNCFFAPISLTGDNAIMIALAGVSQNY